MRLMSIGMGLGNDRLHVMSDKLRIKPKEKVREPKYKKKLNCIHNLTKFENPNIKFGLSLISLIPKRGISEIYFLKSLKAFPPQLITYNLLSL
jgi:hypothetical protein